jgi:anti-sigma factor RsiW
VAGCSRFVTRMASYMYNELSKEERAEIIAHLPECDECMELANDLLRKKLRDQQEKTIQVRCATG